nr:hypothetical protein [Tanacetum cinerariifolium]
VEVVVSVVLLEAVGVVLGGGGVAARVVTVVGCGGWYKWWIVAVVLVVVVAAAVAAGWCSVVRGVDGDGAWGEWHGGSDRSGDGESFWVRRKKPAGKVFSGGMAAGRRWPAARLPAVESISREMCVFISK